MRVEKVNPLVSIVVPIYNVDLYVGKCIESILDQTYKNLEIILVDDGSTDRSGEICDEYARKDLRIKVIHRKNGGLVSARKAGLQEAVGNYATYVDGDDWIEPNMYERLVEQIGSADIIVSGIIRDYSNYSIYEQNAISEGHYKGKDLKSKIYKHMIYTGKFFERGLLTHVWNSLYKKDLLLANQEKVSNDIRVAEDMACLYPTLLDAKEIVITSECYYHYRMRENSMMGANDGEELWRFRILYEYLIERFSEKDDLKENLLYQLDYMMIYCLLLKEMKALQNKEGIFPYKDIKSGDRIVVYGAGRFGCELVKYINAQKKYSIVSWIDEGAKKGNIEEIKNVDFDYVLIAVLIYEIIEEIKNKLVDSGIPQNKILVANMEEISEVRSKVGEILSKK